jgi:hypothetical protein
MNGDLAGFLLFKSYQLSAGRILDALGGRVQIRNSREPQKPPANANQVVGLCGQGGRHAFFHIAMPVLEATAQSILSIHPGQPNAVEELSTLCQNLRHQTVFDDRTGCHNDALPSVVPLLPPEEIWYGGNEMPLDVWRLISFEVDLLSSSVSAHVPMEDVAFGSLSQTGLVFRAMMARLQKRHVEFEVTSEVDPATFSSNSPPYVTRTRVALSRLFLDAGCLLTPVRQNEIAQWYAALRYADWLSATGRQLAVRDEYQRDSVDSRYRGIFAEEIAIGLMAVVLGDGFRAKPIVNTMEYFDTHGWSITKNQPIADFIAEARHPKTGKKCTVVAESKGSLGHAVGNSRILRAKKQVSHTKVSFPGAQQKLPFAFCSSVYFLNQRKQASCSVLDPPGESKGDDLVVDPLGAWCIAFSKAFRFVGLDSASRQVLRGEPVSALYTMLDERNVRDDDERSRRRLRRAKEARERFDADLLLDVGDCALALDRNISSVLHRSGLNAEVLEKLEEASEARLDRERDGNSFFNYLGIGCVFYEDIDRG